MAAGTRLVLAIKAGYRGCFVPEAGTAVATFPHDRDFAHFENLKIMEILKAFVVLKEGCVLMKACVLYWMEMVRM